VVITAIGIDASITATSGNALTINTTGNVTITGLNLNGGGAGFAGVSVTQVGFLRLYSMQVQNFTNSCVDFEASHGNMVLNDSKVNDCYYGLYQSGGQVYVRNTEFDNNSNVAAYSAGGTITIADSSAHYNNYAFAAQGGTMELYGDRAIFNTVALYASNGSLYFADCLVSANTYSYDVGSGGTMAGSSPGTSLITLGQLTVGALSAAQTLF